MNILDISEEEVKEFLSRFKSKDKLDLMFEIHDYLNNDYKIKKIDLDSKEGQNLLRLYVYFMIEELMEMMNTFKSRPWTKTDYPIDMNRVRDEFADFLGFLIQVAKLLNFSSNDLLDIYVRKMIVNKFRIETNY